MVEVAVVIAAVASSAGIVFLIRRYARPLGLIDLPNQRSMHGRSVPRGGGIAIVAVPLLGLGVAGALGLTLEPAAFWGYLGGAVVVALVSLLDDIFTLPFSIRLAVQALAAVIMVGGLALSKHLGGLPAPMQVGWLLAVLAILWTVGLSNAFNFMDGIDGLAASQSIVGGLGLALFASLAHQPWLALLALLVAGSCTGFLIYNWPPASIFMGDVGSVFLGFTFAFLALAIVFSGVTLEFAAVLLVWPFVFDTGFTLIRRLARGRNIFEAHRTHLYQRLVLAHWHPLAVTSFYVILGISACAIATAQWLVAEAIDRIALLGALLLLPALLLAVVIRAEPKQSRRTQP